MLNSRFEPINACTYVSTWIKRSAGVTPEVNLGNTMHAGNKAWIILCIVGRQIKNICYFIEK